MEDSRAVFYSLHMVFSPEPMNINVDTKFYYITKTLLETNITDVLKYLEYYSKLF